MVPEPQFDSYYGRPIIKAPTWKTPDVPGYLFLGGMAGASALLAEGAAMTGRPGLQRVAGGAAAIGAAGGTVALVHDLGRPERFLNMLRVFKVTSPLSVGSYVLAPFGALSAAAFASMAFGRLPRAGRLAGLGAAVLGAPLATYTAALLADTAVPVWHEGHRELPFVFAGSAAAAAGGVAMALAPAAENGPARRMALAGSCVEPAAGVLMERRLGELAEPYWRGRSGVLARTARGLTVGAGLLSLLAGRSRAAAMVSGASYAAGSLALRFAVFEAGLASARDPSYTVLPQKRRTRAASTGGHVG
jgi:hypothetical protein